MTQLALEFRKSENSMTFRMSMTLMLLCSLFLLCIKIISKMKHQNLISNFVKSHNSTLMKYADPHVYQHGDVFL